MLIIAQADRPVQRLDASKLIQDANCVVCAPKTHVHSMSAELSLRTPRIESCLCLRKVQKSGNKAPTDDHVYWD